MTTTVPTKSRRDELRLQYFEHTRLQKWLKIGDAAAATLATVAFILIWIVPIYLMAFPVISAAVLGAYVGMIAFLLWHAWKETFGRKD